MSANRAASIRARLKQHTDTSKQDFNLTLNRYGLQRPAVPAVDLRARAELPAQGCAAVPTLVRAVAPADTRRQPAGLRP